MGGGGGPTKTFTLRQIGGKTPTDVGAPADGQVDQSNTFLFDLLPGTENAGDTILRVSRSTAPTDGSTPWTGDVIPGGTAPSVDGDNDDNGINAIGITTWEMSDDGIQHIFGRVPSLLATNTEGLVIARLGDNLTPVENSTAFTDPANSGIGRNVAVHPDGSSAFAIGNFGVFPSATVTLDVVKYTLSETDAPAQAAQLFSYGDDGVQVGMGSSMDMGGNHLVIGSNPAVTQAGFTHLTQLFNIDSEAWTNPGDPRAGFFNFGSGADNDGQTVRITSDGEHVLYTSPGNADPGSFRVLKTRPDFAEMQVVSSVDVTIPEDITSAGGLGDIETIDSDGNILVVIDSQDNSAGETGPRLLAYAGQPDNLQLIHNTRWGQDGAFGATISSIKITRAAVNTSLTDGAIKSPQPEENVLVTVTGTVDDQGNVGVITFNLDN